MFYKIIVANSNKKKQEQKIPKRAEIERVKPVGACYFSQEDIHFFNRM